MRTIGIFSLNVKDDPEATQQQQCVYLFHSNMYPRYGLESDQNSDFPRVSGVLWTNSRTFLLSLSACLDVWKSWQVDAWVTPDASIWVLYRAGIDSIWTGVGLPTETMTHENRLELSPEITKAVAHFESRGLNGAENIHTNEVKPKSSKKRSTNHADVLLKDIRRAYYRKSLQWHPDRWAGVGSYQVAVSGAFLLVHESYEALSARIAGKQI
jgi:hypothetical protein